MTSSLNRKESAQSTAFGDFPTVASTAASCAATRSSPSSVAAGMHFAGVASLRASLSPTSGSSLQR